MRGAQGLGKWDLTGPSPLLVGLGYISCAHFVFGPSLNEVIENPKTGIRMITASNLVMICQKKIKNARKSTQLIKILGIPILLTKLAGLGLTFTACVGLELDTGLYFYCRAWPGYD